MAKGTTIYFLITYDRSERRLVDMERFRDGKKAVDLYGERERQHADQPHMEIVLLGADSEDAIRATHPTYFRDFDAEPFSLEEVERHLPWLTAQPTPS